jgi:hypothetical protein
MLAYESSCNIRRYAKHNFMGNILEPFLSYVVFIHIFRYTMFIHIFTLLVLMLNTFCVIFTKLLVSFPCYKVAISSRMLETMHP